MMLELKTDSPIETRCYACPRMILKGAEWYWSPRRSGYGKRWCKPCGDLYNEGCTDTQEAAHAAPKPDEPQIVAVLRRRISDLETSLADLRRQDGTLKRHNQTLQNLLGARIDAESDEPDAGGDGANVIWPEPDEPEAMLELDHATRHGRCASCLRTIVARDVVYPAPGRSDDSEPWLCDACGLSYNEGYATCEAKHKADTETAVPIRCVNCRDLTDGSGIRCGGCGVGFFCPSCLAGHHRVDCENAKAKAKAKPDEPSPVANRHKFWCCECSNMIDPRRDNFYASCQECASRQGKTARTRPWREPMSEAVSPPPDEPDAGGDGANVIWPEPDEPEGGGRRSLMQDLEPPTQDEQDVYLWDEACIKSGVPRTSDAKVNAMIRKSMLWDAALAFAPALTANCKVVAATEGVASRAIELADALVVAFERRAKADPDKAEPDEKEGTSCKQHNRWHCVECATEGGGDDDVRSWRAEVVRLRGLVGEAITALETDCEMDGLDRTVRHIKTELNRGAGGGAEGGGDGK